MHGFLGVLVPNDVVDRGPRATASFVDRQMEPHNMLHLVEPYIRRFTAEELAELSELHEIPADEPERLTAVIVDRSGFIDVDGSYLVAAVLSVGVDDDGLYCVTREHEDWKWDVRYWGGRWNGELAAMRSGPESAPFRRHRPSRILTYLQPNMARVGEVLAWMRRTREHPFDALLTPDGEWGYGRCCCSRWPHRGPDCELWAYRDTHSIVGVDFEH